MASPPSIVQTRAENAEARERYLKPNLIRSQQELHDAKEEIASLKPDLAARDKELEEYKQAEEERNKKRKKVDEDKKEEFGAGVGRLKNAQASGATLSEQAQAFLGDRPPPLSAQEQAAVWLAKYGKKK